MRVLATMFYAWLLLAASPVATADDIEFSVSDAAALRGEQVYLHVSINHPGEPLSPISAFAFDIGYQPQTFAEVISVEQIGLPGEFSAPTCVLLQDLSVVRCLAMTASAPAAPFEVATILVRARVGVVAPVGISTLALRNVEAATYNGVILGNIATQNGNLVVCGTAGLPPCLLPTIFIPGVAGSRLGDFAQVPVETVWFSAFNVGEKLSLYPEDNPDPPSPNAKDVRPLGILTDIIGVRDVYGKFLEALRVQGEQRVYAVAGTPSRLTTQGCDLRQRVSSPTFFPFPYDWRLGAAQNAERLADYVGCVRAFYPSRPINLLAHSMGGLVARRYLLVSDAPPIRRLVTVGTPWLGAPSAVQNLENGSFMPLIWTWDDLRYAMPSLPAIAELLPSSFFEALMPGSLVFERGVDFNLDGNPVQSYGQGSLMAALDRRHQRPAPAISVRHSTFASFETSRGGQVDWRSDATGVEYHHVVGLRAIADTAIAVETLRVPVCFAFSCTTVPHVAAIRGLGDGTVPFVSASRLAVGTSLNAPQARVYGVLGSSPEDDGLAEHEGMLRNEVVQGALIRLLRGEPAGLPILNGAAPLAGRGQPYPWFLVKLLGTSGSVTEDPDGADNRFIETSVRALLPGVDVTSSGPFHEEVTLPLPASGAYRVAIPAGAGPITIEVLRFGMNGAPDRAIRWIDRQFAASASLSLRLEASGIVSLAADTGGSIAYLVPDVDVNDAGASDVEPPSVAAQVALVGNRYDMVITATDSTSEVQDVRYRIGGGAYVGYTNPVDVSQQLGQLVEYFATDTVGNRSSLLELRLPAPDPLFADGFE